MTKILKKLFSLIQSRHDLPLHHNEYSALMQIQHSLVSLRKNINVLKEGRCKSLCYTSLDDLELRIAEAIEEKIED